MPAPEFVTSRTEGCSAVEKCQRPSNDARSARSLIAPAHYALRYLRCQRRFNGSQHQGSDVAGKSSYVVRPCDIELRGARRSLASMLARATAVMITPSKIIQAHTVKRADVFLRMQNSPRRHKAAGRNMIDRRLCHGRDPDGRAMSDWRILVRRGDRATKLPR
jgi:hypothetical protein